ncbi:MAG TPA: response regulator [Candidatus Dormibacteraeota bacterium]
MVEVERAKARILLIEDDPDIAQLYVLRLSRDGYVVDLATDGRRGLELAGEGLPDLVFLDLRLPGLDGLEVLRRLRDDTATQAIPVVVITNYDDPELRAQAKALGAIEYVLKSRATPKSIALAVNRWLDEVERSA